MANSEKMIPCPECGLQLPESDLAAQKDHVERNHPSLVIKRLREACCHQQADEYMAWCRMEGIDLHGQL